MKRQATWYFDAISPYAYLQFQRFPDLQERLEIHAVPVLFAGLLGAWGQLGPAEIPAKRIQTYRYAHWLAGQRGVPFRAPPRHPYNPLAILRMVIAAGSTLEAAGAALNHVWGVGRDGQDPDDLRLLAEELGIADMDAAISDPAVKEQLKRNTDDAVAAGVYGVPTFRIGETLFWGDDLTGMILDWLDDPEMLQNGEYARHAEIPTASVRKQSHIR